MKSKNKRRGLCMLMVFFGMFFSCNEEKISLSKPMEILSALKNVSIHGGCDGSIDIEVTGGHPPYQYSWSTNDTTEDLDSISAGTYYLMVNDTKNNTVSDTFELIQPQPDAIKIEFEVDDVSLHGGSDGAAYAFVSGGVKPYLYLWSNGATTHSISGLSAGYYSLTITDARDVSVSDSVLINEPEAEAIVTDYLISHPSFTGASDGTIDLTILQGYGPFTFQWSNDASTEDLTGLPAGEYICTISNCKEESVIDTVVLSDSLTDIDGNNYTIVKIGEQTWMGENLRVEHDPEGNEIASYAYGNDLKNVEKHGRLYTWDAIMNGSTKVGARGICPCGWHIPSDEEFKALEIYLGMEPGEADLSNTWRGEGIGDKLKDGGSSGYDARFSGRRSSSGSYSLLGAFEYVWTSNEDGNYAWRRCLDINSNEIGRWNTFPKTYGFSARCIKDTE